MTDQENHMKNIAKFKALYFVIAFPMVQFTYFLFDYARDGGYSIKTAGMLLSLSAISSSIGQIVLGYISDRIKKVKKVLLYSLLLSACAALILGLVSHPFVLPVMTFFLSFFMVSLYTLIDTWVLNDSVASRDNFSRILSFSPFGRCLASSLLGFVFSRYGYGMLAFTLLGTLFLAIFAIARLPEKEVTASNPITLSAVKGLFAIPSYRTSVIFNFLTYMGVHTLMMYSTAMIRDLGGGPFSVGLYTTISAVTEIFLLLLIQRYAGKYRPYVLIFLVCLTSFFHSILLSFAGTYQVVLALAMLYAVSNSSFLVGSKLLINNALPDSIKMTGQAVGSAIYFSGAGALNAILAGNLAQSLGTQKGLWLYASLIMCSTLYFYIRIKQKPNLTL